MVLRRSFFGIAQLRAWLKRVCGLKVSLNRKGVWGEEKKHRVKLCVNPLPACAHVHINPLEGTKARVTSPKAVKGLAPC